MSEWIVRCACGAVEIEASGRPIVSTACYCSDCQAAGHHLEALSGAPRIVAEDGGTAAVLFRKDRVAFSRGQAQLREYRLKPGSPTRRLVATCCNTPLALDFTQGFWISVYAGRMVPEAPPLDMRTMVKERPEWTVLSDDIPNVEGHSGKFMLKLLGNWALMGFRSPKLPGVPGL